MHGNFFNRMDAGRLLGVKLAKYAGHPDVMVLALPRGGVPVAYEVAAALTAPLDVVVVRKLGVPGDEELALGAIASGGMKVLNSAVLDTIAVPDHKIAEVVTGSSENSSAASGSTAWGTRRGVARPDRHASSTTGSRTVRP